MVAANPNQSLADEISELQDKLKEFQDSARLNDVRDEVQTLQTTINSLPQQISGLRQRGYVFEKDLEGKAAAFNQQWAVLYPNLTNQINLQSSGLTMSLQPVEMQMILVTTTASTGPAASQPLVNSMKSTLDTLESKIEAAQKSINAMYQPLRSQVDPVIQHLKDIDWMLVQLAEAKFQLLSTEGGIMAVKAAWYKSGKEAKDDPEGVLFLTDQRLIFEQKQEIATKKVLFITTAKQKVQQLLFDAPVALVENIQTSKLGFLKNEDNIEIRFASGAPLQMAHFHIWQDCATWLQLINRAKAKDFEAGRAVAVDQEEVAKVKAAPARCPSCGGNINQVVLRGMDSIKCEYCGFVIRL